MLARCERPGSKQRFAIPTAPPRIRTGPRSRSRSSRSRPSAGGIAGGASAGRRPYTGHHGLFRPRSQGMSTATGSYDPQTGAIGAGFAPPDAQYAESEEVAPGVVLDFDAQGRVIGVELLFVRDLLAAGTPAAGMAKAAAAE